MALKKVLSSLILWTLTRLFKRDSQQNLRSSLILVRETLTTRNLRESPIFTQKESPTKILSLLTTWVVLPLNRQCQENLDHQLPGNLQENLLTIETSSWRPSLKSIKRRRTRVMRRTFLSSRRTLKRRIALLPQSILCHQHHQAINLRSVMGTQSLPKELWMMMPCLLSQGNLRGLNQLRRRSQKIPEKTRDQGASQLLNQKINQDLRRKKLLQQLQVYLKEVNWSSKWCLNQKWMECPKRPTSLADLGSQVDPKIKSVKSHNPKENETYNINKGLNKVNEENKPK
jgi:hypothetical protein